MFKPSIALSAALLASPVLADTLIDNAHGLQVGADGKIERFVGLIIGRDGKIVRIVRANDGKPLKNIDRRIDAGGRTLLPGLIDAHGHVMELGLGAIQLDLVGTTSVAELQARLKRYAAANPKSTWIIGRGWNQELWAEKRFPTTADLDAIVSNRPVWLTRIDGHAAVGNGAALREAGVTAASKDPTGGKIERDADGKPTGLFIDAATGLVERKMPAPTPAERDKALSESQQRLLSFGITAVADMGTSLDDWSAMRRMADHSRLRLRIMSYAAGVEPLKAIGQPTAWLYRDHLKMGGVKLYADGALGSRGAWLKQPYADMPDTRGLQFHSDGELGALAEQAAARGFQVATHAIGDAANAQVISTYEALTRRYGARRRWRIEHAQIVDPADIPRIAKAGTIASMQPTHQTSDRMMAEARLGSARLDGAYAWQTILRSGAKLAFGSDFPIESPNPFPGLSAAISRQDQSGQPPGGWRPQERLSFEQALGAFTRGAAYAGFAEDRIGSLDPGHYADFILIDRDPSKVNAQELARTEVLETWVAGVRAWRKPAR